MKDRKRPLQEFIYVFLLLIAIIILFQWYTAQNRHRMEERNKNYAMDSAHITAARVDEEFSSARNLINTYAQFLGDTLTEPTVTRQMLQRMEENSLFDAMLFADAQGVNHTSDGRTADALERTFYQNGMAGESGISTIFDSDFFDETMVRVYAPIRCDGEIIGVLQGTFLAEEYLQKMLITNYFGEQAGGFLCRPDGRVIASSNSNIYEGNLVDELTEQNVIDGDTAAGVREVFENRGVFFEPLDDFILEDVNRSLPVIAEKRDKLLDWLRQNPVEGCEPETFTAWLDDMHCSPDLPVPEVGATEESPAALATIRFTALLLTRILEEKLGGRYAVPQILESLRKYRCARVADNIYRTTYLDRILLDCQDILGMPLNVEYRTRLSLQRLLRY